jgi:predicted ABC-type ATPase
MPTLYILGGANGVGKTTWYQTGIENNSINRELPFVNVDLIAMREPGGYTPENIEKAEQIIREQLKTLIQERKDFILESNLSKSSDYEWIKRMRENGYETSLIFLGTNNVEINKSRVQTRVNEGGHNIPEAIIEQRYQTGLSYLKSEILNFTEAKLVDVSTGPAIEMAHLQQGRIISKELEAPEWVNASLTIARILEQKLQLSNDKVIKPAKSLENEFNNQKPQKKKDRDRGLER